MTIGLIGKKIGMTREFFESGTSVPVTVLLVKKGRIIEVISKTDLKGLLVEMFHDMNSAKARK